MKVTTKGQVTIPVRIREHLNISPHTSVDFRIVGENVVLMKSPDKPEMRSRFRDLRGILKGAGTTAEWMKQTRED